MPRGLQCADVVAAVVWLEVGAALARVGCEGAESPSVPQQAAQTGRLCSQPQLLNASIVVSSTDSGRDPGETFLGMLEWLLPLLHAAGGVTVPQGLCVQIPCAATGLG